MNPPETSLFWLGMAVAQFNMAANLIEEGEIELAYLKGKEALENVVAAQDLMRAEKDQEM